MLGVLLIASLGLPAGVEAPHEQHEAAPGALRVLRQPLVVWFFGGVFFTVLAHTSLYAFLSLYLVSLGYSKTAVGLVWATGVAAEVTWFWLQGRWIERLSAHAWLTLAAALTALRFALVALFGGVPWLLVLLQCLHALTFAAQHSSVIAVINEHFPGRLRGRGQALYIVLGYGASGVVGGLVGGALSEAFGFPAVFWGASAAGLAAVGCSLRAWRLAQAR
jgi:PPP family 3-phenylpropionic acid transporter